MINCSSCLTSGAQYLGYADHSNSLTIQNQIHAQMNTVHIFIKKVGHMESG